MNDVVFLKQERDKEYKSIDIFENGKELGCDDPGHMEVVDLLRIIFPF